MAKVSLPMKYQSSENEGYAYVVFRKASYVKSALAASNQEVGNALKIFCVKLKEILVGRRRNLFPQYFVHIMLV